MQKTEDETGQLQIMNKTYKTTCYSLEDTKKLAEKFAKLTKGGAFINLFGEIGAGKTAFVRCVAQALDIKEKVTSLKGKSINL